MKTLALIVLLGLSGVVMASSLDREVLLEEPDPNTIRGLTVIAMPTPFETPAMAAPRAAACNWKIACLKAGKWTLENEREFAKMLADAAIAQARQKIDVRIER